MDYTIQNIEDGLRVSLSGRMTLMDHDKFRAVVAEMQKMHGSRCILDLSKLEFVDSSGLGMFLIARDIAVPKNVTVELHGAVSDVARVLDIARFNALFLIRG